MPCSITKALDIISKKKNKISFLILKIKEPYKNTNKYENRLVSLSTKTSFEFIGSKKLIIIETINL